MNKRDYVSEIIEIRSRTGGKSTYLDAIIRLQRINSLLEAEGHVLLEAIRYCPVGLVACLEAYFRGVVKELIDYGQPYLERASKLERVKFDFSIVAAIQGYTISIGDMISHLIPINNKNDINSALTILTGEDFLKSLKEVKAHWPWESMRSEGIEPVIKNPSNVYGIIDRVFEVRHIICHEFANPLEISKDVAQSYIEAVQEFIDASNFISMALIFKDIPDTQTERTIYYCEKYKKSEGKLVEILKTVKNKFEPARLSEFIELQKKWEEYRENEAEFISSRFGSGTIRPQIKCQELRRLTNMRIYEINHILEAECP